MTRPGSRWVVARSRAGEPARAQWGSGAAGLRTDLCPHLPSVGLDLRAIRCLDCEDTILPCLRKPTRVPSGRPGWSLAESWALERPCAAWLE